MRDYRKDIDGLRAVAVSLVIFYHLSLPFAKTGFIGVDVFFVISGFLITSHIDKAITCGQFSLKQFYVKRMRRILPALLVVLFFSTIIAFFVLLPNALKTYMQSLTAALFSVSNFYFYHFIHEGYFGTNAKVLPLLHTWSLGVEEQFYIVWPITLLALCRLFKRPKLMQIVFAACAVSFLMYFFLRLHEKFVFYLPITRAFELLIGAIIALHYRHKTPKISLTQRNLLAATAVALILTGGCLIAKTAYPGAAILLPCLGAGMLIITGMTGSFCNSLLAAKPLVWIGLISYSLYLWHWPIIAFLHYFNIPLTPSIDIIVISLSILLAYLTWHYIEKPFRFKYKFNFLQTAKRFLIQPIIAAALLTISLDTITPNLGFNSISEQAYAITQNFYGPLKNMHCEDATQNDYLKNPNCYLGDKTARKTSAVIIGDSHAMALAGFFNYLLKNAKQKGRLLATSGTPFILGEIHDWRSNHPMEKNKLAAKLLSEKHFKWTIIAGFWDYYPNEVFQKHHGSHQSFSILKHGLETAIKKALHSNSTPILVYDVPPLLNISKYCGFTKLSRLHRCKNQLNIVKEKQHKTRNMIALLKKDFPKLKTIDLTKLICKDNACMSSINGIPLYATDHANSHLSYPGSLLLGKLYLKENRNPFLEGNTAIIQKVNQSNMTSNKTDIS